MPKKKTLASASTSSTKGGKSQGEPIRNNVREQRQRQVIEDLLEHISVWHMAGQEVESGARGKACQVFQTLLDELDACGIYVFGGRSNKSHLSETKSREGTLIFKRADDPQIIQPRLLRQFGKAMCLITAPVDR